MKFSYDWIRELAGTSLDAQAAADVLSAKAFEVEELAPAAGDIVLDIKILPNRPDCLSHLGIARELCALTGQRFHAPAYEYKTGSPAVAVDVRDPDACPRYSALMVRGVTVGPSPAWLRGRLEACGLKSINNVVDVTNYVMLELGQPLHAFDAALVDRIVVRRAAAGERFRALDQATTEYALDGTMLVIADSSKPLAIAGIKGGVGSGISDTTTDVLLEAASFAPEDVRATGRKLGLRTDASVRFSYGVDPNLTAAALVRAGELLHKAAGGTADGSIVDVYPVHRTAQTVMLDPEYARGLLGVHVADAQIMSILGALGFDVAAHGGALRVTVPTRRLDVTTAEDLIEEVGRVYGYDAIPSAPPVLPIYDEKHWVREQDTEYAWDEREFVIERQNIGHVLAGAGYSEVYNYVFLSDELKELLRLSELHELALPQSGEYRWLRRSLVPRLLVNLRDNLRFTDEVRLFETGHVFDHFSGEDENPRHIRESARLALALSRRGADNGPFYELKGVVDLLLERLGVADYYYDDRAPFDWDAGAVNATAAGQQALIRLEGDQHIIGFIGAVSSRVADPLKLKGSAAVAELCLRSLVRHAQQEREFQALPRYPSVIRDLSLLVQTDTKIDDILQVIQEADDAGIVRDVDVFDIFLPTGKEKLKEEGDTPAYGKSVALHVIYRSDERTLTDQEVSLIEDGIKKALQEKLDVRIR